MPNSSVHVKDSLIQECITSQCHAWSVVIYSSAIYNGTLHAQSWAPQIIKNQQMYNYIAIDVEPRTACV